MQLIRREHYRSMPWKNGGGVTQEIAVYPRDSDLSHFGWRLSLARVASEGPFSTFPGIDRTIVLLEGQGILLEMPSGKQVILHEGGEPFTFAGELPVSSRNIGGATTEFNVMSRRGAFTHAVRMVRTLPEQLKGDEVVALIVLADVDLAIEKIPTRVNRFDTLLLSRGDLYPKVIEGQSFSALSVIMTARSASRYPKPNPGAAAFEQLCR